MGYVISNNKLVPIETVSRNIDEGLLYGYGIFETILVRNQTPIYLKEHYSRLVKGLTQVKISFEMNYGEFRSYVKEYMNINKLNSSVLRITVYKSGEGFMMMFNHRENTYKPINYREGFKMEISEFKRNPRSLVSNIKSVNYLENIYALKEAKAIGSNEVLFLDTKNYISEGATSNIFFAKDGILYTPTKECGLLEGTIRAKVIEIVENNRNLKIKKGYFSLNKILTADEVFLTNSVMGIMPVRKIDHTEYDLKKSRITGILMEELNREFDNYKD